MIEWRRSLSLEERMRYSRTAQEAVIASDWFVQARTILLYMAFRGEVLTPMIAESAGLCGKRVALPRVQKEPRKLWLHTYAGDPAGLVRGAYGLAEPDPSWPPVAPGEVDLVVTPGVAFDRRGRRLGYGGGYYDRLLLEVKAANPKAAVLGLAYGFQVFARLPDDPHDVPVDGLATDLGLIICQS